MTTNHFARFRFNLVERWIPLLIIFVSFYAAWLLFAKYYIISGILCIIGIYWIYRFICVWKYHFVIFEEKGIIVRKGFFFRPNHFRFDQITNIRTIKPDKHIHFKLDQTHDVNLSLSKIKKADRIRFIFLIESDVNRLVINASK